MDNTAPSRRQFLLGTGLLLGDAGIGRVRAQVAPSGSQQPEHGRLVVVLLRGAYDGLSAFVPYTDADYYSSRPNIAIASPDGSDRTSIRLDNTFALHPALSPLLPLWRIRPVDAVHQLGNGYGADGDLHLARALADVLQEAFHRLPLALGVDNHAGIYD